MIRTGQLTKQFLAIAFVMTTLVHAYIVQMSDHPVRYGTTTVVARVGGAR